MFFDPVHHAVECPARLAALVNILLLVVEIRVIDTRCAGDENVYITGDESLGTISRVSM
jgi:hypothetical protein